MVSTTLLNLAFLLVQVDTTICEVWLPRQSIEIKREMKVKPLHHSQSRKFAGMQLFSTVNLQCGFSRI